MTKRLDRENLKTGARVLLWALIIILFLRGLTGVLGRSDPAPASAPVAKPEAAWPDDAARAFALDFASEYLTVRGDPEKAAARLARFAPPELLATILPTVPQHGEPSPVPALAVASARRLSDARALVVVAAGTRRLSVPVERTGQQLGLFDAPAFLAAPAPPGGTDPEATEPLGPEDAEVRDVVQRFLTAYMAGDAQAAAYYAKPDARLGALQSPLEFKGLDDLQRAGDGTIVASVRARTASCKVKRVPGCGVTYPLRYRIRMEHAERWQVSAVNPGEEQ